MDKIEVKLFGMPEVKLNDINIKFPFKKADALFYYLLIVKKTTRDNLVNIFWADSEDSVAKKNLRNAIYIIKKTLNLEVFISPQRSIIQLNDDIEILLDIDYIYEFKDDSINAYSGSFLEGLHIKKCENFDNWKLSQQQYFENQYLQKSINLAREYYKEEKYDLVEEHCKKLNQIDPFDEEVYRLLMKSYFKSGRYDKSISLYKELVKLLDDELDITPDSSTIELNAMIVKTKSQIKKNIKKENDKFFYGREKQVKLLKENYFDYLNEENYVNYLIQGEIGVGKSELLNEISNIFKADGITTIKVFCYQPVEGINLRVWDDLIEKLGLVVEENAIEVPDFIRLPISSAFPIFEKKVISELNIRITDEQVFKRTIIETAIYELLKLVVSKINLLLIFEDIQWLDKPSLSILKRLINARDLKTPIVYMSCRNAHSDEIDKFIFEFSSKEIIKKIELERFNEDETLDFIKKYTDKEVTDDLKRVGYKETEGNAFFIMELLNSLKYGEKINEFSPKFKDSIRNRLLNLSKSSLLIIQFASAYLKKFSVEDIVSVSEKSEFEAIDSIEQLESMYLIKEELDGYGNAVFSFTHSKIKEYIYNDLSLSKRKILHTRIAKKLEADIYEFDRNVYSILIYHYTKANNLAKVLEYRIKNLYEYLQSSHEVFPLIKERDVFNHENIFFEEYEIEEEFNKIEKSLLNIKNRYNEENIYELKLKFRHMTGRYYINNGLYKKGLSEINRLIELSKLKENNEYLIKSYLQNIFYSINTHNITFMNSNINLALKIAKKEDMKYEIGILMRLKGLYYVLKSDFKKGEQLLLTSIDMMKKFIDKDKYTLNIAAAYYYMGDSNRFKGNFVESISYYEKAIEICEDNDLFGRLTLFYTNAGHSSYNLGEYLNAQRYFESAIKLYEQLDFPWRRSIAYGFLGLLKVKKGKYSDALELFILARDYSSKMKNPYELAVINRIMAELENILLEDNIYSSDLQNFIESDNVDYIGNGIEYLKNFYNCYEMKRLKELKIKRELL